MEDEDDGDAKKLSLRKGIKNWETFRCVVGEKSAFVLGFELESWNNLVTAAPF